MTWEEKIFYERLEAKKEGQIEGKIEGQIVSIIQLLEEYGTVPEDIREKLYAEKDSERIKKWLRLAARVDSIDEFMEKM